MNDLSTELKKVVEQLRSRVADLNSPSGLNGALTEGHICGLEEACSIIEARTLYIEAPTQDKHPAAESARELGKVFEGLARAFEEGHVEDDSVICLAVACDEFFAAYRAMVGPL